MITFDIDKSVSEIIKKENLSDKIVSNPKEAVNKCRFSFNFNSFKQALKSAVNSIKDHLKSGSILTDTSSVKKGPNEIIKKIKLKIFHGFPVIQLLEQKKVDQWLVFRII